VVEAHAAEQNSLSSFAARGENCLVVLPGNHDAALVLDEAWKPLGAALAADGGCVVRPRDGIWVSPDGRILVEHGHQIGWDANRYDDWPTITKAVDGVEYVRQPWGEAFVQRLFNAEEAQTPLIDNLSPSSAGVRHRMSEQGPGSSIQDVARFLRFNLFDTSLRQKIQFLGDPEVPKPQWNVVEARKLGHRLFALALPPDDPFAVALRDAPEWAELRRDLDELARTLPEPELLALCDQVAIRKSGVTCETKVLGAGLEAMIFSRAGVLKRHLIERQKERPGVSSFLYGHTHSFELPWDVEVSDLSVVRVANSGAFQRLIDDERLVALAKAEGISPLQFLKRRTPESLPACYTAVAVSWSPAGPQLETRAWSMAEDGAAGRFVDPCSDHCAKVGHGCAAP
jgi:hypothetical protein